MFLQRLNPPEKRWQCLGTRDITAGVLVKGWAGSKGLALGTWDMRAGRITGCKEALGRSLPPGCPQGRTLFCPQKVE